MKRLRLILIIITILLLVGTILYKKFYSSSLTLNSGENSNEKGEDAPLNSDQENILVLTENTRSKLPIQIIQASEKEYSSRIEISGEIQADPDSTQTIGTRIPGKIIKIYKKEGDTVKKGEILVEMDSPEISRLRSKYQSSNSRYFTAKKNADRIRELTEMKLASDQEARNAEAEAKNWELELKADKEALTTNGISADSSGTRVIYRSPISGHLIRRMVQPGDLVSENTNFLVVANLNSVWFTAQVFEKDLSYLKKGMAVTILLNAYPNQTFTGRLTYIGSSVDSITRTIPARVSVSNSEGLLKIGLFGKAVLNEENPKLGSREAQLVQVMIPESSLLNYNNETAVFIQNSDLEYEWRVVEVGDPQEGWLPIISGIQKGERVVSNGSYSLKAIFLKSTFGEED
jgi:cobalt-zinc-cadmium efflux system membrane fusion protein